MAVLRIRIRMDRIILVSWIRIPNADSRCGCGSESSYEISIKNKIINTVSCDKKLEFLNILLLFKNRFTSKGQSSENLVKFFFTYGIWIGLGMNKNLWKISEPEAAVHFQAWVYPYMSKTELKSRWTVPLKISDTITWLTVVQQGHESGSASALRFFPGSASAIFRCWSATLKNGTKFSVTLFYKSYLIPILYRTSVLSLLNP